MENPNSRPYTPEELEVLLSEEAQSTNSSDTPQNNKGGKGKARYTSAGEAGTKAEVIAVYKPSETLDTPACDNQLQGRSKLQTYAPFIILGVILAGVGIYLYYDYTKRKKEERERK